MSKQVQERRGTSTGHANFTGALAEITVDTETNELVLGDGVTAGGRRVGISRVTTSDLVNSVVKYPESDVIETCGFTTAGDGGSGKWKQNGVTGQTPSQTPAQLGDAVLNDASGNQWEWLGKTLTTLGLGVKVGESISLQEAVENSAIINAARFNLVKKGGGELRDSGNIILLQKDNPDGSGISPDDWAIHWYGNGCALIGLKGVSEFRRHGSSTSPFTIIRMGPLPIQNGVITYFDGLISGWTLDGNVINNDDAPSGQFDLLWLHGYERATLRDLYIKNGEHYGIGMQNGGHKFVTLENILIYNVGADGIDIKNNSESIGGDGIDIGNKMNNITVKKFGRSASVSQDWSGVDIMGAWQMSNIFALDYGDYGFVGSGIRIKQAAKQLDRGEGGQKSSLTNYRCIALPRSVGSTESSQPSGLTLRSQDNQITNGHSEGCYQGLVVEQANNVMSNIINRSCFIGVQTKKGQEPTNGDDNYFSNVTSINCLDDGWLIDTTGNEMVNCASVNSGVRGIQFTSNSENNNWLGGRIKDNVQLIRNVGSDNQVDCRDVPRNKSIESSPISVDSVSTQTFSVDHGFDFTPQKKDISFTVIRDQNSSPWGSSRLILTGVSSTIVSGQLTISEASATPGAECTISVHISRDTLGGTV